MTSTPRAFVLLMFCCSAINLSFAQDFRPIGTWKDHLNYRSAAWLTQSEDEVIVSTGTALIYIDKQDGSHTTVSKVDDLSESQLAQIKYDKVNDWLIVMYNSGAFDLIGKDEKYYITSIKDNNVVAGSKAINDIFLTGDKYAYFATSFGIIEYDLQRIEFRSTTFTNKPVSSITADNQYIYAALDDGVYRIARNDNSKENFSRWQGLDAAFGLPAMYKADLVEVYNNQLYATINGKLMVLNPQGQFNAIDLQFETPFGIQWMSAEGAHLAIGLRDNEYSSTARFINASGEVIVGGASCINRTLYGIEDQQGRMWYADEWRQIRFTNSINGGCNKIEYDSPYSLECSNIEIAPNRVLFAGGGANENYQIDFNRSGVYILNPDQSWTNINEEYFPALKEKEIIGFMTVVPHPKDTSLIYMGSFLSGIVEYNTTSQAMRFFSDNSNNGKIKSSLQAMVGAPTQVRVSHMQFDEDGNLWVANFGAQKPISVFASDGKWYSFATPGPTFLTKVNIDQRGNKWFATTASSPGVVVFNENGTPEDPSDDEIKFINNSNSIISSQVNCVETDLNGDVWVGTSEGPIVFECDPFDTDCRGTQRKVLEDSIAALLLLTEEIFSIETDGANRKWFGTRNGIFVQSPDGETQIYRYTTENSALLHNQIVDLEFDNNSGTMFMSTQSGIQSLKTNATGGAKINTGTAYAYPNPVRPEYQGPIAIKGLARDADVRITDVNGRLVHQSKALGGQAIWDGNDYTGSRVDTGVYLVFAANENDPTVKDVIVTKILIVK
jgi:sugar lactone lactonase YvrE